MRSPDRRAAAVLLVLAAAFAVIAVTATISRSLIPRAMDGTVDRVEVRTEKHPGIDDVWLVHVNGDVIHVDATTATDLEQGAELQKAAWSRTLTVDGQAIDLHLSHDARTMLWVMPLTLLCVAGAAMADSRRRSPPAAQAGAATT